MTVINHFIRVLKFVFFFFILSCTKQEHKEEEENTYQIINLLTRTEREMTYLRFFPHFPPPPDGGTYVFTTKDSLSSYKYFYEQYSKKKLIAFWKDMSPISEGGLRIIKECGIDEELIKRAESRNQVQEIDISKIFISKAGIRKDSLIYYTKEHKEKLGRGFIEIDVLLNFSRITFNHNYTKAILGMGRSYERLNGAATVVYLEKKDYHWRIKCKKVLSIS